MCLVKFDISKAFDLVRWDYLLTLDTERLPTSMDGLGGGFIVYGYVTGVDERNPGTASGSWSRAAPGRPAVTTALHPHHGPTPTLSPPSN